MNNKGKNFITIMIVTAVTALALRIAIEQVLKFNIVQNESQASVVLKLVATALENYSRDNQGKYPVDILSLTRTTPPYLDQDYTQSRFKGYNFSCSKLDVSGYICSAVPVKCQITGKTVYTVTTGNLFVTEACDRKE